MLEDRNALEVYRKDASRGWTVRRSNRTKQEDQPDPEGYQDIREEGLSGKDGSLGQADTEDGEGCSEHERPEVVHLGRRVGTVRQDGQKRYQEEALGNVQPEYPTPAQQLDDGSSVERAQH